MQNIECRTTLPFIVPNTSIPKQNINQNLFNNFNHVISVPLHMNPCDALTRSAQHLTLLTNAHLQLRKWFGNEWISMLYFGSRHSSPFCPKKLNLPDQRLLRPGSSTKIVLSAICWRVRGCWNPVQNAASTGNEWLRCGLWWSHSSQWEDWSLTELGLAIHTCREQTGC